MNNSWQSELEEYIRQGEPEQSEKSAAWKTAIGLQDVDGLKTSAYLLETAREHIEGKIDIKAAQKRIQNYYEERSERAGIESDTKEADIVSARIAMILGEKTFQFSPAEWFSIHRRLFLGVLKYAGEIRPYNITKKEWVLRGETVYYASCDSIKETLEYDFGREREFSYENLTMPEVIRHFAKFTAGTWQIHPFCEGNTRATAVFMIQYLKSLGFRVDNNQFSVHSWYFRNALVRANYNDLKNGIHETTMYLERFFENLLLGKDHELKNRYLHVDYRKEMCEDQILRESSQPGMKMSDKTSDKMSDKEQRFYRSLLIAYEKCDFVTTKMMSEMIGMPESTTRRYLSKFCEIGLIRAEGKNKGTKYYMNALV